MATTKLYIIHGWTYTVDPWNKTIELLKDRGISVEMLHVPGLTAESSKVWTIEDYVAWAHRELPQGALALGHSNGGRILMNLAIAHPDQLRHLILLDSAGIYDVSRRRDLLRRLSKTLAPLKKVPLLRKVVHKAVGANDYSRAPENMKKTLTNMLDSDRRLDPSQVTVPTTILWGQADTVTPPRHAERLHAAIAGSQLKIYQNWTHAPYISDPEGLARAIATAVNAAEKAAPAPVKAPAAPTKTATKPASKAATKPAARPAAKPAASKPTPKASAMPQMKGRK